MIRIELVLGKNFEFIEKITATELGDQPVSFEQFGNILLLKQNCVCDLSIQSRFKTAPLVKITKDMFVSTDMDVSHANDGKMEIS